MKFSQDLGARWKAMPVSRRITMLAIVVGTLVGGSMAWSRINQPTWAVLYSNLDDAQASAVLAKLDAKGISHKVDGNGTRISVPKQSLIQARLNLAADGVTGKTVPAGWSILDKEGLATSDLKQRVDYQRALEGELSITLMSMAAISSAAVHLTLPEKPIYAGSKADSVKPTASVLLGLRRPLAGDETDTVTNLVASAVENLTVGNFTVASTDGLILHAPGDVAGNGGVTSSKAFKATRDYEAARSAELSALAARLTQQPGAQVAVRAELDYAESTIETETVDPTKQVPTAVQADEETWTGSGGTAAGGTVGVDGGPLPGANGASTGTYSKKGSTTQYAGGRTVTKTVGAPGTIKKLSIAVVVPFDDTGNGPAVDEAAISRVIGAAAGIDTTRGDTIEVATVPATITPTTAVPTATTPVVPGGLPVPIVAGAGGGLFLLFLIFKLRGRKKKKKATAAALEALNQLQGNNDLAHGVPANWASNAPAGMAAARQETDSIRADLDRMANETPESLAALLSTWLSKS